MKDRKHGAIPRGIEELVGVPTGGERAGFRLSVAIRSGNPDSTDPWQWSCGSYPGSHPGECTNGIAAIFDDARAKFESALGWCSSQSVSRPTFRRGGTIGTGPPRNIAALIVASACRTNA
jgi:hypothetical protein